MDDRASLDVRDRSLTRISNRSVTRVRDGFRRRSWPSWTLLVAPGVRGCAIAWMFVLSAVRVLAFRKLRPSLQTRPA